MAKGLPPPKDFKGIQDYQEVWHEEMVALAMALQMCAFILECPWRWSVGQCESPANASPLWLIVAINLILRCWMWQRGIPWSLPLQRGTHCQHPVWKNQPVYLPWRRPTAPHGCINFWAEESKPPPLENAE